LLPIVGTETDALDYNGRFAVRTSVIPTDLNFTSALTLAAALAAWPAFGVEPASVRTAPMAEVAIYPQRSAPATVVSLNDARISAQLDARVVEIPVKVGDTVEAGTVLARLDCADFETMHARRTAGLEAIDARLMLAKRRVERTGKLVDRQSAAEDLFDERRADVAVLEADRKSALKALQQARTDVTRCELTSPFKAVILERLSAVGDFASKGTPLVRILDLENIEISAQVATADTAPLSAAGEVFFVHAEQRYPVEIRTVLPTVNTQTRNREVRLLFSAQSALPGAAGELVWTDSRPHVPGELLVRRGEAFGVFAEVGGIARFIEVPAAQPGRASLAPIPGDTHVVIEGYFSLQDADPLSVVN
jgi:RND family efflux transporter MFP subunit